MCTYEYPFGEPFILDGETKNSAVERVKEKVLNEEPDMSKIPAAYSEKTKEFILMFLKKARTE